MRAKGRKRKKLSKYEVMAILNKAVDLIRQKKEIHIVVLAHFLDVTPYFIAKHIPLILELFEDIRYNEMTRTFYTVS